MRCPFPTSQKNRFFNMRPRDLGSTDTGVAFHDLDSCAKIRPALVFMGMNKGPREICVHNIDICRDTGLHFQVCGKRFADSFNMASAFTELQNRRAGQGIKALARRISCYAWNLPPSEDMPHTVAPPSNVRPHDCPWYFPAKGGKPLCHKVFAFHSHSIVAGACPTTGISSFLPKDTDSTG